MRGFLMLAVVLGLAVHETQSFHALLRRRLGRYGMMRTPSSHLHDEPKEQWLEQKLDHSDGGDPRTWRQRYWVNETFWDRPSGPVFLMIGGESEASPGWLVAGNMMTNARKYHAMAVLLEHRFYGNSRPTSDLSLSNLVYLSSQQALADLVTLHHHIVQQYNLTNSTKWVCFGGSYSGALSAWFRIKYPDLVVGAVASSAPVQAEYDFYQYLEVVEQSLRTAANHGDDCVDAIKNASVVLDTLLLDPVNWPAVERLFNITTPMQFMEDAKLLSTSLTGLFMEAVQYNQPRRSDLLADSDVTNLCDVMINASLGPPLSRLASLTELMTSSFPLSVNFTHELEELKKTSWFSPFAAMERQWFYQTCKEFAFFQVSSSSFQPFGKLITLDLFDIMCRDVYGIDWFTVENNVHKTNEYYGGKNISTSATNIVFPNGSIDPWHALSMTRNLSDSLVAIYIQGTSHCADMKDPSVDDPPSLTKGREAISEAIGSWLSQDLSANRYYHQL